MGVGGHDCSVLLVVLFEGRNLVVVRLLDVFVKAGLICDTVVITRKK